MADKVRTAFVFNTSTQNTINKYADGLAKYRNLSVSCIIVCIDSLTLPPTALTSACDLISTSTTDESPLSAAKCNGVHLLYSQ